MNFFGSNKYGEKKFYKTFHYNEPIRQSYFIIAAVFGFFSCFYFLCSFYAWKKVIK